jgi:hypothetical protein
MKSISQNQKPYSIKHFTILIEILIYLQYSNVNLIYFINLL